MMLPLIVSLIAISWPLASGQSLGIRNRHDSTQDDMTKQLWTQMHQKDLLTNHFMDEVKRLREQLNDKDKLLEKTREELDDARKQLIQCATNQRGATSKSFDLGKVVRDTSLVYATNPANGKTYFMSKTLSLTHNETIAYCKHFGAMAIEPKSKAENDWIFEELKPMSNHGYLGVKCENHKVPTTFMSGSAMQWTNWAVGQPIKAEWECTTVHWRPTRKWYVSGGGPKNRGTPICEST